MRVLRATPWLLIALGCACGPSLPSPTATATTEPIPPTNTATSTATNTPLPPTYAPYTLATPATLLEAPHSTQTPEPTLLAVDLPPERITIFRPGHGSNVTNRFLVQGRAGPSWSQRVRVRLLGEDARVLADYYARLFGLPDRASRFGIYVDFSISMLAEAGRLVISSYGPTDGMVDHMASVDLILLSRGQPLIHYLPEPLEKMVILLPQEHATVRGGSVIVRGAGWVDSEMPLIVQVLDRQGNVAGSGEAILEAPSVGQLGIFEVEISYSLPYHQAGRIGVLEMGTTPPSPVHYTSIEVNLRP